MELWVSLLSAESGTRFAVLVSANFRSHKDTYK